MHTRDVAKYKSMNNQNEQILGPILNLVQSGIRHNASTFASLRTIQLLFYHSALMFLKYKCTCVYLNAYGHVSLKVMCAALLVYSNLEAAESSCMKGTEYALYFKLLVEICCCCRWSACPFTSDLIRSICFKENCSFPLH